jgi:hypothetical protein
MPSLDEAKAIAQRLRSLSGGSELVRKAVARELGRLEPIDATELLQHWVVLARSGHEVAIDILPAVTAALELEQEAIPFAGELKRVAEVQDLEQVSALLVEAPPRKEMDAGAAAKADARLFSSTLGQLKSQARLTRNPDVLSKLATYSDPSVIRNVLLNPRLTEDLVVRIAARRPARPEPLTEIWRSNKWSTRHAVRRALAFNPYLPPEIGSKVLPLLNRADLKELAADNAIHPALRDQAKLLLAEPKSLQETKGAAVDGKKVN